MKKKNSKVVVTGTLPGCSEQSLMRAHRTGWSTAASAAVVLPQLEIRPTAAAAVAMIAVAVVGAVVVEHLILVIVGSVVVAEVARWPIFLTALALTSRNLTPLKT